MPAARAKKKPWNNTVVAILHLTNLCIGLAICFFVAEYQRSQLSALNVSNEEIEGNPQLQKWSADDNHCIIMFDQLVAIGATIGGIASVACLFGLFAVCARPARKCLHFFGLGLTISMWITAIGFGIAMLIDYNNDHVIFNSGYGSGCYNDIAGEDWIPNTSATRVSSYCTDSQHPNLYKTWPDACPQTYQPAVDQLEAYMNGSASSNGTAYNASQSRLFMSNYQQCLNATVVYGAAGTTVCDGCMEVGAACLTAVNDNVLKAQHWDGIFMIIAGGVALVWSLVMAYFVQWEKKQKPVEDVVEDIEQDDAVEGKALLNDDPAYDSPKSIANEPVEIGKQDDAAEGQGLLNDDADDIEAVA